jgi:hypothetical protein
MDMKPRESRAAQRRVARRTSGRLVRGPKTIEAYLRANSPPRYMERLREIETEYRIQLWRLEAVYDSLREAFAGDPGSFSELWQRQARVWSFESLNELIREHNQWYPVEAGLPMDVRTRDFVPVRGASYRRIELGPDWILEHLPPRLHDGFARPRFPARAPREPL